MPRRSTSCAPLDAMRRALVDDYVPLAKAEARLASERLGLDPASSDECRSEAYSILLRAAQLWEPARGVAFAVYARVCLRKRLLNYGRGRRPTSPIPDELVDRRAPEATDRLEAIEETGAWWSKLSPLKREIVRIMAIEGRTKEEAARETGCTPATARNYYFAAQQALRA